jgi:peptide subunit release factor 1 (eRF1)
MDEYRAGALGVVGARDTLKALMNGQAYELVIASDPSQLQDDTLAASEGEEERVEAMPAAQYATGAAAATAESSKIALAESLVQRARQTAAAITFIEDSAPLAGVGGVGALLRFRL